MKVNGKLSNNYSAVLHIIYVDTCYIGIYNVYCILKTCHS